MYLSGFGNHHQTEASKGALPLNQNSPKQCPYDLFAEQLSGSAFTRARHLNLHTWLYRKKPSVVHDDYVRYIDNKHAVQSLATEQAPNPWRWSTLSTPQKSLDFID